MALDNIFKKNNEQNNQTDQVNEAQERLRKEKESLLAEIKGIGNDKENSDNPAKNSNIERNKETNTVPEPPADLTEEELEGAFTQSAFMDTDVTPLPKHTKGVIIIPVMVVLTIIAVITGHLPYIKLGIPSSKIVIYAYMGIGFLLFILGGMILISAISDSQIFTNIELGKLVTTGIYSKTRNPIYFGVLLICTAALFVSGNAFMYILIFVFYLAITIVVQKTEEPILVDRFAYDYIEYMACTNRLIPIPKKAPKKSETNK